LVNELPTNYKKQKQELIIHSLNTIKRMNSPEYQLQQYQMKKFEPVEKNVVETETTELKLEVEKLKKELETTKEQLTEIQLKFRNGLIDRLGKIQDVNNTLPIGIDIKICETDYDNPKVVGKLEEETKKFYIINGKRYHKKGLEFYDVINEVVVLEDTTW
jgi:hypothetical protein